MPHFVHWQRLPEVRVGWISPVPDFPNFPSPSFAPRLADVGGEDRRRDGGSPSPAKHSRLTVTVDQMLAVFVALLAGLEQEVCTKVSLEQRPPGPRDRRASPSSLILAEAEEIADLRNSFLKSRARIFDGSGVRFFGVHRKSCIARSRLHRAQNNRVGVRLGTHRIYSGIELRTIGD